MLSPCPARRSPSGRSAGASRPSAGCASSRRPARRPGPGSVGALLGREGLCGSHLVDWCRQHRPGAPSSLARPRGRPEPHPLAAENEQLRRRNARLERRLASAERIVEVRGEVSELPGVPLAQGSGDDESGS